MNPRVIRPGERSGVAAVPASKSELHRILIAAALSEGESTIRANGLSEDVLSTAECLSALGARVRIREDKPEQEIGIQSILRESRPSFSDGSQGKVTLPCRESGSTLRFLLPLVGALGIPSCFEREGRLPERPLSPLSEELERHGMKLVSDGAKLYAEGRLLSGAYTVPGDISSQFITGLLYALPLLEGDSKLLVTGRVESEDYIRMTLDVLSRAGIEIREERNGEGVLYRVPGRQRYRLSGRIDPGGDWSGAAFFLSLGALSERGVTVEGISAHTLQGDRAIIEILKRFGARVEEEETRVTVYKDQLKGCTVDAAMVPDLVPVVSVIAALSEGETRIIRAGRLKLKESDRLKTTADLIRALGGHAEESGDGLRIVGVPKLTGGQVSSAGDHRIAMSAAVAAAGSRSEVVIEDPEVVRKSFPDFYQVLEGLERRPVQ